MQLATQTVGKLRNINGVILSSTAIDFSMANLQGMDLRNLNFGQSRWVGARMQGSQLTETNLQGADLFAARLEGAFLGGTNLKSAEMFQTTLFGAQLIRTELRGAYVVSPRFDKLTQIESIEQVGASLKHTDLTAVPGLSEGLSLIFGDGTNQAAPWPKHWPRAKLAYVDFILAWRTWVTENHPDVLQYLPDEPEA